MALRNNENKLKFGLKRVAFAIANIDEDGSATYGDVIYFPGARALSVEPQGAGDPWIADDVVYYSNTAPTIRQGDLEMARFIDAFKRMVLGYVADGNDVLVEDMNPETVHFALLFETMNDVSPRRYVLYNCVATAPTVGSGTNEGSKDPVTETSMITSSGIYVASHGKWFDHGVSTPKTDPEAYANWFSTVQLPGPPPDPYPVNTVTGSTIVISDAADDMAVEAMSVVINPIQSGSGDPSPTNIRSINGHTGVTVKRVGRNLLEPFSYSARGITTEPLEDGTMRSYGTRTRDDGYVTPNNTVDIDDSGFRVGDTFTLSCGADVFFSARFFDENQQEISRTGAAAEGIPVTAVIPVGTRYIRYVCQFGSTQLVVGEEIDLTSWFQVEHGDSANTFVPYHRDTYTDAFPADPGTVYGGTLDVVSGELTVDMAYVSTTWGECTGAKDIGTTITRKTIILSEMFKSNIGSGFDGICSMCTYALGEAETPHYYLMVRQSGASITKYACIFLPNDTSEDQEIQIAYRIRDAHTYQLSPTEIRTLLGDNIIWANTGETTVSYHSDPIFDDE